MTEFDVTVVIPCHNDADYIAEAVESVWNQQGANVGEVVIVSDRSDGRTQAVLEQLACDGRVRVVENQGPPGPAAARNTGWRVAQSDWVAFLDADDVLVRDSLAVRVSAAERFRGAKWVAGDFYLWRPGTEEEPEVFFSNRALARHVLGLDENVDDVLRMSRPVEAFLQLALAHLCATLVHKDVLSELNGFDESLTWVEDYEFSIRAAQRYDFVFVRKPLFYYRQHPESTTNRPATWPPKYWHEKALSRLYRDERFAPYRAQIRVRLSHFAWENSLFYRQRGEWRKAIRSASMACRWRPSRPAVWKSLAAALIGR